jgi:hypothetical protein
MMTYSVERLGQYSVCVYGCGLAPLGVALPLKKEKFQGQVSPLADSAYAGDSRKLY